MIREDSTFSTPVIPRNSLVYLAQCVGGFNGPVHEQLRSAASRIESSILSIAILLGIICPLHIPSLIVTRRIDPIQRMPRRGFITKLCYELAKGLKAKLDTDTAVARIADVVSICAASLCRMVSPILWTDLVFRGVAVIESKLLRLSYLSGETPARQSFLMNKRIDPDFSNCATGAATSPIDGTSSAQGSFNDSQTTNLLSCQISLADLHKLFYRTKCLLVPENCK